MPFVVLTDGKTWSFYLPAEQGSYEDRRVYKLDLFERPVAESSATLERYLAQKRVESGEALDTARKEYRSRNRKSQARAAIPDAWRELVEKGDESLVELLGGAVESKIGVRPDDDDVAEYLAGLGRLRGGEMSRIQSVSSHSPTNPTAPTPVQRQVGESTRSGRLVLRGKTYASANVKDAMVIVLRELVKSDATFLERCSPHPHRQGRKRRYIARTPEELYPDREDLRDCRESLPGGWLVATNLNNVLKKTIVRLAADVAGLEFGKEVVVDF